MSFTGLPFLTSAILVATNAWADDSPERTDRMVVTEVDFDSEDDDSTLELHGQTRDLEGLEVRFSDYGQRIKVGDTVTVWTRTGACGCRWHTRDSILRLQGNGELITE